MPLWAGVLVTGADAFLLLFMERLGVRILEGLFGILIAVMASSFGLMFWWADVPGKEVVQGFLIPRLPSKDVPTVSRLISLYLNRTGDESPLSRRPWLWSARSSCHITSTCIVRLSSRGDLFRRQRLAKEWPWFIFPSNQLCH